MSEKLEVQIKDDKIYAPLKEKWLVLKPEEKVRQKYIYRLVNHYGFSLEQMAQELQVNNSQRGQGRAMADIVIWKNKEDKEQSNSPIIVIECKAETINIKEDDYFQGYNYASWAGANFFVTTNDKETKIFRVVKGKIPKKLVEIVDIPQEKDINNKKKIEDLLKQTKAFVRDEFSKLLFKCHNIIRNNDKLSPEAAFDEISKILFMKIRYERNPDESNIFTLEQFNKQENNYKKNIEPTLKRQNPNFSMSYLDFWFDETKQEFKNDDLFEDNEVIKIRENSFKDIIKELEIYNLSTTSDDVKGIAFEKFLGRTFRGELGQFFTPRVIVDFMSEVLDLKENELVCDPCCGSGGFLIKAFEDVREKIEIDIQKEKEKVKQKYFTEEYENMSDKDKQKVDDTVNKEIETLNKELVISKIDDIKKKVKKEKPLTRLEELSHNCIYGTDANPRMARVSKMNMIMHGDGHGGVHHNDGLLNVNGIFKNRFDVILTNPPFGSRVDKGYKVADEDKYRDQEKINEYTEKYGEEYTEALKEVNNNIGKKLVDLFDTGKMSTLTETLFIERCLHLLKQGGRMGIVLPEGVLNTSNLQKVREYIESKAKIILITSLPQDVFIASGATVKPSLVFLKKFTQEEEDIYKKIEKDATKSINAKYKPELDKIKEDLKQKLSKEEKDILKTKEKEIKQAIPKEIRTIIKKEFNYEIPIAEIEKAGIDTTGKEIENELIPLAKEFSNYRKAVKLW